MPVSLPSSLPVVSLAPVTLESLTAEVDALVAQSFSAASSHAGDLVADADEMTGALDDIPDLVARGYKVSEALVDRVRILAAMLAPNASERDRASTARSVPKKERGEIRKRLLAIRSALGSIATAAGLPSNLFALGTNNSTRVNVVIERVARVLDNAKALRAELPDTARVEALIAEGEGLIARVRSLRGAGAVALHSDTTLTRRYQATGRLLLDALVYFSRQGRAAYPDDPTRYSRYALDHVYGRKASVAGDPGAGGKSGHPEVVDPDDPISDADA